MIEFDPRKDAANLAKHGISLSRADDMSIEVVWPDPYRAEARWRAFGRIQGKTFCLIFTLRDGRRRAISLRRAHKKEFRRHVLPEE
ncbi:BrnT family toxin [Brevundimonas aurifodinae]|uniref:BrnT family toxin n=2 Tax=Brevundimonas TaxID=41275 RepID=A0ABV1NQB5_9CAUL|nr:MAG: hypothetical protein B7Z42_15200 [Brevundimonas sp. 12-68-7]OYX32125.1 MAG: hypothetical protein B7Z01_11635 [Brevundimonas subvibrioides]